MRLSARPCFLLALLALPSAFRACVISCDEAGEASAEPLSGATQPLCGAPGPCWADIQTVNIGGSSAPGRTGQWWCTNHFGGNLAGAWECVEDTGSNCSSQVPNNGTVQCGRLNADGATPYYGQTRFAVPFGYGRVERVLVTQSAAGRTGNWWCRNHFGNNYGGQWKCRGVSGGNSCDATVPNGELANCSLYEDVQSVNVGGQSAPGRTGQWWCTNHFGTNLGGSWDCLSVTGGSCTTTVPMSSTVTCGRYTTVDESAFAPTSCSAPSADPAEQEFCNHTEYMMTRATSTLYLYNDWIRAGFNRSFGGALFELYGTDKRNRIEEHGGSAVQLSIWGYDAAALNAAYFQTNGCNVTAYAGPSDCQIANGGAACVYRPTGAHVSNCITEFSCGTWTAAGPWNPIQAQAASCGWNGPTNDVTQISELSGAVTFVKSNPYHFTKTTAFSGLTWQVTGKVQATRPYLEATYRMIYLSSRAVGEHNQEIPALFTDGTIDHWYYYYGGGSPYADLTGPVTRKRSDFGTELKLPGRSGTMPQAPPASYSVATEEWMTGCDRLESQCLTVATFAPGVKTLAQSGQYVTPLGRFGLGTNLDTTWTIYLFPYRYDDVVAGKSVRQWIYDLKNGL